jgi:hypothetical protein
VITATAAPAIEKLRAIETRRLRRQQQLVELCRTPRLVFELIDELARHHPEIVEDIDRRMAKYTAADRDMLRATGGGRMPAVPMYLVAGGER